MLTIGRDADVESLYGHIGIKQLLNRRRAIVENRFTKRSLWIPVICSRVCGGSQACQREDRGHQRIYRCSQSVWSRSLQGYKTAMLAAHRRGMVQQYGRSQSLRDVQSVQSNCSSNGESRWTTLLDAQQQHVLKLENSKNGAPTTAQPLPLSIRTKISTLNVATKSKERPVFRMVPLNDTIATDPTESSSASHSSRNQTDNSGRKLSKSMSGNLSISSKGDAAGTAGVAGSCSSHRQMARAKRSSSLQKRKSGTTAVRRVYHHVGFGSVVVREYHRIVSDHPAVSGGPPVGYVIQRVCVQWFFVSLVGSM
jgi:hypothetical protein